MSDKLVNPEDFLSDLEKEELFKWRRSKDPAPLALYTSVKMYELFLLGHSCTEIAKANENKFPVGMIIDARMRHEWDRRREAYLDKLFSEAGDTVKQRQVEGAMFLADVLAAAHKQHGDKLKKFIQTGDANDLPAELKINTITQYKMVVDALLNITGQAKKSDGGKDGATVQVIGNNVSVNEGPKKIPKGEDALAILKLFDQRDKQK